MELGRRLLFLLFVISFPKNTVSNVYYVLFLSITDMLISVLFVLFMLGMYRNQHV